MSLSENISIIDMKYGDPDDMDERTKKLLDKKPKLFEFTSKSSS